MKKNILIVIVAILGVVLICIGSILIIKDNKSTFSNKKLSNEEVETSQKENKPNLTVEEEGELIFKLEEYGKKMYENGSYLSLNQDEEAYYITLGELKERGYSEIATMVYDCKDYDPIIQFYKDTTQFEGYPIGVSYYCNN